MEIEHLPNLHNTFSMRNSLEFIEVWQIFIQDGQIMGCLMFFPHFLEYPLHKLWNTLGIYGEIEKNYHIFLGHE